MLVVLGFVGMLMFLRTNPRLAQDLNDAWNGTHIIQHSPIPQRSAQRTLRSVVWCGLSTDKDNSRFARMQKSLEHHATQLRRYIALQEQMRASRRYDV
jgi:hypothetical protein